MGAFNDAMREGISETLDVTGETITFRGVNYNASVSELGEAPMYDTGSEILRKTCSVVLKIPTTDFTPPIRKDERISTPHGEMQIASNTKGFGSYRLILTEVFRK